MKTGTQYIEDRLLGNKLKKSIEKLLILSESLLND